MCIYPDEGANLQLVRDHVRWETRVLSDFQNNKRNFFFRVRLKHLHRASVKAQHAVYVTRYNDKLDIILVQVLYLVIPQVLHRMRE